MLNHIAIMGRLTADPELRYTPNQTPVVGFAIAVDRGVQNGEKITDFIDCVAWRQTAEFIAKYFTKGRMMVIEGKLQTRAWKDENGRNRKIVEILVQSAFFGDSKPIAAPTNAANTSAQSGYTYREATLADFERADEQEELPF